LANSKPTLWTCSLDYFATGEGRTVMAHIGSASDEDGARQQFGKVFDDFYARDCNVEKGVVRNDITRLLWSEEALSLFEKVNGRGAIEASSKFHFNLS
jgi:hypothetical protein